MNAAFDVQNQNPVYCQVGFHLQGICLGVVGADNIDIYTESTSIYRISKNKELLYKLNAINTINVQV